MSKEFPTINKESPSINREATIIYRGHNDNVFTVAWSPDGKYIASGSRDKTVRIWDVATVAPRFIVGDSLFIYRGHVAASLAIMVIPASCAASPGLQMGDTSPRVEITVIVRRRCGRPLPESISIPMISSTGYFPLPGRQTFLHPHSTPR